MKNALFPPEFANYQWSMKMFYASSWTSHCIVMTRAKFMLIR